MGGELFSPSAGVGAGLSGIKVSAYVPGFTLYNSFMYISL